MRLKTNRKTIKYTLPIGLIIGILVGIDFYKEGFNLLGFIVVSFLLGIGNFIVVQAVVDTFTGVYKRKESG